MARKSLGRGLASLIPGSEDAEGQGESRLIPVDRIARNPYQPRRTFDAEKMAELVASVREHGILQPVVIRRAGHAGYELVAGERRLRAAREAGLTEIPAVLREYTGREMVEIALVENVQREDITPLDAAKAYRRLMDEFGMTQDALSLRVGKSRSAISNTMRLLTLPLEVQQSLDTGEISEGHARALMTIEDPAAALVVWRRVVQRGLSVRETEQAARNAGVFGDRAGVTDTARVSRAAGALRDPNLAAVVDALQEALGTRVTIGPAGKQGAGRIAIEFYCAEDLERIVEILLRKGRAR